MTQNQLHACIIWHDRHASYPFRIKHTVILHKAPMLPCTRKAKNLLFETVPYAFGMRVAAS
jgi:hypothetical protein